LRLVDRRGAGATTDLEGRISESRYSPATLLIPSKRQPESIR
jgi:hypothetical protein